MVGVLWHFHLFSHRRTSVPFTDCMPVSSPDPPILIGRLHRRWTLVLDICLGRLATRSGRLSGVEQLIRTKIGIGCPSLGLSLDCQRIPLAILQCTVVLLLPPVPVSMAHWLKSVF